MIEVPSPKTTKKSLQRKNYTVQFELNQPLHKNDKLYVFHFPKDGHKPSSGLLATGYLIGREVQWDTESYCCSVKEKKNLIDRNRKRIKYYKPKRKGKQETLR